MEDVHTRRCAAIGLAVETETLSDTQPLVMLIDVDELQATIARLKAAPYPEKPLHTFAIKANPVGKILEVCRDAGLGAETASYGELRQALHVGFPPHRVVFDSPAKTKYELEYALRTGVCLNCDNLQELGRVASLLERHPEWAKAAYEGPEAQAFIGLRINPEVGAGSIAALSTAVPHSKFGIPLRDNRQRVLEAYRSYPWLRALHLHVGSQGCPAEMIAQGAAVVWELLQEIESVTSHGHIRVLDVGGGVSVNYETDDPDMSANYEEHAALLRKHVPALFDESRDIMLVTEFGRSLLAKCGIVASRVEYAKVAGGRRLAVVHMGADLLMRTAYLPQTWGVRFFVFDEEGRPKPDEEDKLVAQDIVGPLCFQGDVIAEHRPLPAIQAGDIVMAVDVGAYTLSMYSRYNSRFSPAVYGYSTDPSSGKLQLEIFRSQDSVEDVLRFWNQIHTDDAGKTS